MTSGPYGDQPQPEPPGYPATGGQPAPWPDAGYSGQYGTGYGGGYPAPPPYQQAAFPPPPAAFPGGYGHGQPRNGVGTAGLVLGIIGLVFCWTLWIGWVLNVLAIIFGGVGTHRAGHGLATNKGSAVAGLVMGIVGLIAGIIIWVAVGAFLFSIGHSGGYTGG